MIKSKLNIIILVFSPHGNTLKVANAVKDGFLKQGIQIDLINLTGRSWDEITNFNYSIIKDSDLLIVGFPVYGWRVIRPMEIILSNLPTVKEKYAGIFVTYGRASGLALFQGGTILIEKGYNLLAGIKIVAKHSRIIDDDTNPDPYNKFRTHPNKEDLDMMKNFVQILLKKLNNPKAEQINLNSLVPKISSRISSWMYRILGPIILKRDIIDSLFPEPFFNKDVCIQCGKCARSCPLKLITLEPYPKRNGVCVKCHNCIRVCPTNAIHLSLKARILTYYHDRIMFRNYIEDPWSKIYA
jgi:ferredoxin/multimeric flavodoxin WrbA